MTQQITKQTLDAIMADERFHNATKDTPPGLLIAMMIALAMYHKELPGDDAVAAPAAEGQGPTDERKPASTTPFGAEYSATSSHNGPIMLSEKILSKLLGVPVEALTESDSDSESEFDSECPVVAQVAALTEQVDTLRDDMKTLVEVCRSQQNQLKLLGDLVFNPPGDPFVRSMVAKSN